MKQNPKGLTIDEISKKLPLNRTSTAKYLNTLQISGQAEMRSFGRAKVFTLSQRLPFSKMLNLSSDLLVVLDQDLIIDQVNEAFLKIFNTNRQDLVGHPIRDSPFAGYLGEKNLLMIQDAAAGKEFSNIDRLEIDGKEFFFRIEMIPVVFDQGGQGLAVVLKDITELKQYQQHLERLVEDRTKELRETNAHLTLEIEERRKSQAALEESEGKYRELVENANSIILRVNDEGTILFFNEFAEKFFKISQSEMLGKNIIGTLLSPDTASEKLPEDRARDFLTSSVQNAYTEVPCMGKNDIQIWVAWTIKPVLTSENVPTGYLLVGMDITERKNVENALHRVNTKLNLVSSIVRHDILNKLTVISGTISLLQEMLTEKKHLDYLHNAEAAVLAIRNQILFTRDFKDMGMEKASWQELGEIIHQIRQAGGWGNLSLDHPDQPVELFADPWLNRVFSHLIDHIRKQRDFDNKIVIRYLETPGGLALSVEGNGSGIPADRKERIFDQDFSGGNGYHLFLDREILAITNLSIHEEGIPGSGECFVIRAPKGTYRLRTVH